ncbi:hypothetical protein [Streptomyces prunicolor]
MATTARRPELQLFSIGGERFTAAVMTSADLAVLDIEHLGLPEDRTRMQGLRGWDVYDGAGLHIGRAIARSCVVAAEWFDTVAEDWLLARWSCRRLERAVCEIARLRDDIEGERAAASARKEEQEQRAAYAAYLQQHGLVLDEDGEEVYASRDRSTGATPTFGDAFRR